MWRDYYDNENKRTMIFVAGVVIIAIIVWFVSGCGGAK